MKKLSVIIAGFILVLGMSKIAVAQNNTANHDVTIQVPTIALVGVEGSAGTTSITLSPNVSGLQAGEAVNFENATNSDLWLNYTSIVNSGNARKIDAKIDGNLPAGLDILLNVGGVTSGNGTRGVTTGNDVVLVSSAQDVVSGIGSCYTEKGQNKGRQLTYRLKTNNDNYGTILASDSYSITVIYTISED
jgi:hypothetical protein